MMKNNWYMLTLVGKDQPGIVARITTALYEAGCQLGEASMSRLGGTFSILLMVMADDDRSRLLEQITPIAESLDLHIHVDDIDARLHDHHIPDVRVSVYGTDRPGIVAQVTTVLADAGLDILELESDVAGSDEQQIYIMHMEGHAANGIKSLECALEELSSDIEVSLEAIDVLVG
jgi:glycine cleavage system transcriptional repressor